MSFIHIAQARTLINRGGVIAYPTEAVWGLGCDPFNQQAVERILALKKRPWQKGLLLVSGDIEVFRPLLSLIPENRQKEILQSWPGPNTWVLPDPGVYPDWVRGTHRSIAVRVTNHPLVSELTRQLGYPVISTSANPAGMFPAKTLFKSRCYFGDKVDYYLPGMLGGLNQPTTIRDALTGRVLRG
ncbi:tRNA threonylcarbamoyladenosine biosynthesis protein RimN [Hahella sp. CCB-MM4]|uniref:L-threonylcarbamoyladenylate synthase n=1 Tax=Hahella sp. (strain CCB-MM4) TaxID=1926491 RepID=UPI000B9A60E7|nr:Sua5/YciO/YrdC/YwlC family protein [Hahella sp. CCB-MM4]OZG73259.1 tRNA threonylcarbamoyladenosine biosynthesis protein RimN [Hahella sp. CCB-MM4]